ncbi:Hpt domain-containing protein [Siculibacillus lacustris]|uniref:Hpt domain-containing protein n=1 Tax=Siculibacillus lacustris TaxID=1549641 RepID=A0A4Q9VJL6_9HYPH|nr:Hpt domain-containing protein [Siculibacillus lacustris]TBW34618.1 Hpt domain-containing protein [Siculibacillus lacustris]
MAKRVTPVVDDTEADMTDAGLGIDETTVFIQPPNDLRKKTRPSARKAGDPDPVAAAEAALQRMAESFDGWMTEETQRLAALWTQADASGFDPELRSDFYRAAHDIKGQAATLGYPIAGRIAASLCRLLDGTAPERMPRELVRQHVQSVRAIISENAREDSSDTARLLADRLDEVTDDYLEQIATAA